MKKTTFCCGVCGVDEILPPGQEDLPETWGDLCFRAHCLPNALSDRPGPDLVKSIDLCPDCLTKVLSVLHGAPVLTRGEDVSDAGRVMGGEIPSLTIDDEPFSVVGLLCLSGIASCGDNARTMISFGEVSVDGVKVLGSNALLPAAASSVVSVGSRRIRVVRPAADPEEVAGVPERKLEVTRADDCIWLRDSLGDQSVEIHMVPSQALEVGRKLVEVSGLGAGAKPKDSPPILDGHLGPPRPPADWGKSDEAPPLPTPGKDDPVVLLVQIPLESSPPQHRYRTLWFLLSASDDGSIGNFEAVAESEAEIEFMRDAPLATWHGKALEVWGPYRYGTE